VGYGTVYDANAIEQNFGLVAHGRIGTDLVARQWFGAAAGATFLSNNTWSLNSTFEGAHAGVSPFTTLTSLPQTLAKVSAGAAAGRFIKS
jgi:hypothetical protein